LPENGRLFVRRWACWAHNVAGDDRHGAKQVSVSLLKRPRRQPHATLRDGEPIWMHAEPALRPIQESIRHRPDWVKVSTLQKGV